MEVTLYKFSKRQNSTLRPPLDTPNKRKFTNAKINDDESSILSPSIRLNEIVDNYGNAVNVTQYNYVEIPVFNRYYYVNNWNYNGDGTWTAVCSVDVLASWKTDIVNSGGYVERSTTDMPQTANAYDPVYTPTETFITGRVTGNTGLTHNPYNGTFVLGVVSNQSPNVGSVSYYVVNHDNMALMLSKLYSNSASTSWDDITLQSDSAVKSIIDPIQYIVSCKWFPFSLNLAQNDAIFLGAWDTTASGYKLPLNPFSANTNHTVLDEDHHVELRDPYSDVNYGLWSYIELPHQIEDADEGYFPLFDESAHCSLITPWGVIDLPTTYIRNINAPATSSNKARLYYKIVADLVGGSAIFEIGCWPYFNNTYSHADFIIMTKRQIQLAKDIPMSQVSYNYVGLAQTAANSFAVGASVLGGVSGVFNAVSGVLNSYIDTAVNKTRPSVTSTSMGSTAMTADLPNVCYQEIRYKTIARAPQLTGKMRFAYTANLVGFSGFLKMAITTFAADCTDTEANDIITMLKSGVFIE